MNRTLLSIGRASWGLERYDVHVSHSFIPNSVEDCCFIMEALCPRMECSLLADNYLGQQRNIQNCRKGSAQGYKMANYTCHVCQ